MKHIIQAALVIVLICVFLCASTNEDKISTWNTLIDAYETNLNEMERLRPLLIEELENPHTRNIGMLRQLKVTDETWKQLNKSWKKFKKALEY